MKITIDTILQCDYEGTDERGFVGTSARPSQQLIKTIIPERYADEIKALCDYAGIDNLSSGTKIQMFLQEILNLIPRKRPRIDSYRMLIKFLKDEMNVDLILTSRKTK